MPKTYQNSVEIGSMTQTTECWKRLYSPRSILIFTDRSWQGANPFPSTHVRWLQLQQTIWRVSRASCGSLSPNSFLIRKSIFHTNSSIKRQGVLTAYGRLVLTWHLHMLVQFFSTSAANMPCCECFATLQLQWTFWKFQGALAVGKRFL